MVSEVIIDKSNEPEKISTAVIIGNKIPASSTDSADPWFPLRQEPDHALTWRERFHFQPATLWVITLVAVLVCGYTIIHGSSRSHGADRPEEGLSHPGSSVQVDFEGTGSATSSAVPPPPRTIVVSILGAVQHPGVYSVSPTMRINDLINRAGGVRDSANLRGINLAEILEDEEQITISGDSLDSYIQRPGHDGSLVNINTAQPDTLAAVPGVGKSLAASIIVYRKQHGQFASLDDLLNVPGIKSAKLGKIRAYLRC